MTLPAIVIGGGVVGLASALALQRAGVTTLLIDDGSEHPASWGNAGHLATEHTAPFASPRTLASFLPRLFAFGGPVDFVWRDIGNWAPWAARFASRSTPKGFASGRAALAGLADQSMAAWWRLVEPDKDLVKTDGHWLVWESARTAGIGVRIMERNHAGPATFRPMTSHELADLHGELAVPNLHGLRYFNTGQVTDVARMLRVLSSRIVEAGGEIVNARATGIARCHGEVRVTLEGGQSRPGSAVVVAAGVWSKPLLAQVGLHAPLIAERGYHVEFDGPELSTAHSPIVFADRSIVATRLGNALRATSFVEFGRSESRADPRKWAWLEHQLRQLGILKGQPVRRWMGARPTLPDYLPAIGGGEIPGVYYATGHAHLGLTLAALTGELVRDMITGTPPTVDLAPFALGRFARRSPIGHRAPTSDPLQLPS